MPAKVLPRDPTWRPEAAQLAKLKKAKWLWRAADINSFEDATGRAAASAGDFPVACGHAVYEWTAAGSWSLVSNNCTDACSPNEPDPSTDDMPEGLQVSTPCI